MTIRTRDCLFCGEAFEYEAKAGTQPRYCSPQHQSRAQTARRTERVGAMTKRWCPRGKHMVPIAGFSSPTAPYCKPCWADRAREKRAADPDPLRSRRESLARYGLTFEQFDAMLTAQG